MLHTKFRGNWPAGSGEEGLKVSSDFHFLVLESFRTKFGSYQHSSF